MGKYMAATVGIVVLAALAAFGYTQLFVAAAPAVETAAAPLVSNVNLVPQDLGTAAANAALDASGAKERIDEALRAAAPDIASQTGLPETLVQAGIDTLDVPSWQVATLPETAEAQGTFPVEYEGLEGSVTVYDDPAFVSLNTYGLDVTFAVPESAQAYTNLLTLLG